MLIYSTFHILTSIFASLNVPENAPFTAVLKYAAEEVSCSREIKYILANF